MKFKILLLFLISTLVIYYTYNRVYKKTIHVLSINNLDTKNNYNNHVSNLLSNTNINYLFNVDFCGKNLQVDNLIAEIEYNKNNIQAYIHESEVIIISINNNIKGFEDKLEKLFSLLRKYNSKEIIYVSTYNLKNTLLLKKICNKNNIIYINGVSFHMNPSLIANIIVKKIDNSWNKEKY